MSSYVPRAEDAPRKLSHAEVALHFGADEYSHKSVEMPDRGRSNSYVVRDEQPGAVSSHAQVSAMHGADDYTLRQFHVPSQRQAQEALHRMRQRGAVAATAVNKVSLLFASAIIYCAYLAWFGVVEVARRKADGIPFVLGTDDVSGGGGGVSALWWHAVVWSAVVYGFFFGALALYARRCESAADAQSDAEQARTEIERTSFGKCLSLFSKAGLFAASYAWYEAIRLSLLVAAPTTSLWAWLAAAGVTMFFAALVAMLSAFERGLEEKLPSGAALTNKALSAEEKRGLVKLKVVWLMNDGIASSFAWIVALLIVSALQRSIQFQFWDADEPTKPVAPAVRRAAEWALFFLSAAFSALVLVAKEKALLSHGTDAFDDKEDGMPCAGCRSVLCQMEKKEGTGRQTKAMMKGAVIGVLLGAMAGAAVGNQGFDGIKGASIGAMVGAFGLSALGAGLGAVAYVVEQAEATNLVKKGPAALKMLGAGVAKLEKMAEGLREGVDRAIMSESVFDELANVMSLAQQLTEEATVWLCAITLFDAARGTFADPTTLADTAMAQYGRMLIFAVALTFLGAAAAYAMQLVLEQKAHELVHALGEDSSVKRRELYFATDLAGEYCCSLIEPYLSFPCCSQSHPAAHHHFCLFVCPHYSRSRCPLPPPFRLFFRRDRGQRHRAAGGPHLELRHRRRALVLQHPHRRQHAHRALRRGRDHRRALPQPAHCARSAHRV